ncbi:MAG: hypothetical protein GWP08_16100 [Nitrospiraceae bacterium]|nr:hypothetical protein [Nitrospiraceae bacterium]
MLDRDFSCRVSYDYLGAYTLQPIALPPPPHTIPKEPILWDMALPEVRSYGWGRPSMAYNHVPGGGNVLWLDGSVSFLKHEDWAGINLPAIPQGIAYEWPYTAPEPKKPTEVDREAAAKILKNFSGKRSLGRAVKTKP